MLCWSAKTVCYAATERAEKKKKFYAHKEWPNFLGFTFE